MSLLLLSDGGNLDLAGDGAGSGFLLLTLPDGAGVRPGKKKGKRRYILPNGMVVYGTSDELVRFRQKAVAPQPDQVDGPARKKIKARQSNIKAPPPFGETVIPPPLEFPTVDSVDMTAQMKRWENEAIALLLAAD